MINLSPLGLSILIHGLFSIVFLWLLLTKNDPKQTRLIKIKMIEATDVKSDTTVLKKIETTQAIDIKTQNKVIESKKKTVTKRVFGASQKTLTSTQGKVTSVKAGNTISKEVDNEKMQGNEALPEPVAEYLVSEMPSIKSQPRIKYPEQARSSGIEGVVVLDILIDEQGEVRRAQVAQGLSPLLDAEALAVIRKFVFIPAKINQRAVAIRINFTVNFVLED